MIYRKRSAIPLSLVACKDCEGKSCKGNGCQYPGAREKIDTHSWIESDPPRKKDRRPAFKAYKNPDVVSALETLFHRKCAYCESPYGPVHPVDVEHWRPKSEVSIIGLDGKREPRHGYEWLAMDWENLLPSCIDCNRRRYHSTLKGTEELMGKANLFPVRDESKRLKFPGDIGEEPLLLNPCEDDPEAFFDFDEWGAVFPRQDISPLQKDRAAASIQVYGLNRLSLVDERVRSLRWLELEFRVVRFLFDTSGDTSLHADMRKIATDLYRQMLDRLNERMKTSQPYSACLKKRLLPFLEELSKRPMASIN